MIPDKTQGSRVDKSAQVATIIDMSNALSAKCGHHRWRYAILKSACMPHIQ